MMDDLDGPSVGLLVPSANPVVEPELHRLLPAAVKLYVARFPVMRDTTLLERNRRYLDIYPETLQAFGGLRRDATVIGLTGPSYRLLPAGDEALVAQLSAPAGPVQTASNAIRLALHALGASRLCLVSPYPQWLTDESVAYWEAAGHTVAEVVKISETFRAYQLTTQEVSDALQTVGGDVDAIVMSGTGMLTLPAILASRKESSIPFLSSNLCCAWWTTRYLRAPSSALLAAASPELAERLG